MYSYKIMNGKEYVIHNASGCSLPYHSKANRYSDVPDWKKDVFRAWIKNFSNARRKRIKHMKPDCKCIEDTFQTPFISLAPLPKAVPCVEVPFGSLPGEYIKKEGKTPMRFNETNAYASVSAPKSDIAIQRDFLLSQLADAWYPKDRELENFFNLHVDNTPKTYKEMIDAIKNDKFKIDPKAKKIIEADADDEDEELPCGYWGPMYGIIWDGPVADREGYHKARDEARKQKTAAERIIMTSDGAAGLAALQAFEAWLPTSEAGTAS